MSQLGSIAAFPGPFGGALTFQNVYNNALNANSQLSQNIESGYNTILKNQQQAYNQLGAGYGQLSNDVMGIIQGMDASQLQAAKDVYTQQQGATQQGAISKGLGNSTVLASLSRGNTADYVKATTAIENQFAGLKAGYKSQVGLAGLNAQQQGIAAQTALGAQGLAALGQFQIPYAGIPGNLGSGGGGGASTAGDPGGVPYPPGWFGGGSNPYDPNWLSNQDNVSLGGGGSGASGNATPQQTYSYDPRTGQSTPIGPDMGRYYDSTGYNPYGSSSGYNPYGSYMGDLPPGGGDTTNVGTGDEFY